MSISEGKLSPVHVFYLFKSSRQQPHVRGCSQWHLGSEWDGSVCLLGTGRHQHAQRGKARFCGRYLSSSHFVQALNIGLPGGNFLRGHVAASVLGEVVAAHESPVANGTHELLLAGVCPPVTRQLVGASEPLVAAVPAAAERLLA